MVFISSSSKIESFIIQKKKLKVKYSGEKERESYKNNNRVGKREDTKLKPKRFKSKKCV